MGNDLQQHYARLLGLGSPWTVRQLEWKMDPEANAYRACCIGKSVREPAAGAA